MRTTTKTLSNLRIIFVSIILNFDWITTSKATEIIKECVTDTLPKFETGDVIISTYSDILSYCYSQSFYQSAIDMETVRKNIYERQIFQNEVMLWMVVAITLSGVLLAGIQLAISYKLSLTGRDDQSSISEFTIEKDKLAVKSSITGLLILAFSFSFFFIYVFFVFKIEDQSNIQSSSVSENTTTPLLVPGQLIPSIVGSKALDESETKDQTTHSADPTLLQKNEIIE